MRPRYILDTHAGALRLYGATISVDEEIEFVKSQIDHHGRSVTFMRSRGDAAKANRHAGILRRFEEILPKMIEAQSLRSSEFQNPTSKEKVGSRFWDISDLPESLKKQIVSIQYDQTE